MPLCFLNVCLAYLLFLKLETVNSPETSMDIYQASRHIPEDGTFLKFGLFEDTSSNINILFKAFLTNYILVDTSFEELTFFIVL
jgi:hypothetical protein